jgi:hypothetical protein
MAKIKIVSSMIFDAICFFEHLAVDYGAALPEQKVFREKIEKLTADRLKGDFLSMSWLCGKISHYAYDRNDELENYTLNNLAEFFRNPENVRDENILGSMYESAIYKERSFEEWAKKYINYINILEEIGFDKLWESDLLPIIQEDIKRRQKICENLNMDGAFADIQKLKQCEPLEDIKIYISVMNFPVAFKLQGNSFSDMVTGSMGIGICHELMHGFTNKELENLYLDYVRSDKHLMELHDILINGMRSGNEEEFVVAADAYLRMRHNGEDKKELLKQVRSDYNGCIPPAVFLFDLLTKEPDVPNGYAQWLTDIFKNKKLPQESIEKHLDDIVPMN